jgi:bifunctional aspartokinase / homoserine dehydrogenase 1
MTTSSAKALNITNTNGHGFAGHEGQSVYAQHVARQATNANKPLRVMKFGGTSVGDASCIARVIEIVRAASRESRVIVVVSAMSGVTDKLIEAAEQSASGNFQHAAAILESLRKRHTAAASALIRSQATRNRLRRRMRKLCHQGSRLCQEAALLCALTPRARDEMASLGERLSVFLVAAALAERGITSEVIEATELIVTNSNHGAADPRMHLTRQLCDTRLGPLVRQGIVPVVTGFIGATPEGVLTTLGRGGSDYSATILAAAVDADEVAIWKDVDGLLTADPHLVPEAGTIPEISYEEAGDLAEFGAKVLHRKTLRPMIGRGIAVRICNTFAPEGPGTIIRDDDCSNGKGIKALVAISDAALISIHRAGIAAEFRNFSASGWTNAAIRKCVPVTSQPPRQDEVCLAVSADFAESVVEAVRNEFSPDSLERKAMRITVRHGVAIVTLAGQYRNTASEMGRRISDVFSQQKVSVLAAGERSPGYGFSFVVAQSDLQAALASAHREFCLDGLNSQGPAGRIH